MENKQLKRKLSEDINYLNHAQLEFLKQIYPQNLLESLKPTEKFNLFRIIIQISTMFNIEIN